MYKCTHWIHNCLSQLISYAHSMLEFQSEIPISSVQMKNTNKFTYSQWFIFNSHWFWHHRTTTFYYLIIASLFGIFEKALCVSIDFHLRIFVLFFALFSFNVNCIKRMKISAFDDSIYIYRFQRVHWSYQNYFPERERNFELLNAFYPHICCSHTHTNNCLIFNRVNFLTPTNKNHICSTNNRSLCMNLTEFNCPFVFYLIEYLD